MSSVRSGQASWATGAAGLTRQKTTPSPQGDDLGRRCERRRRLRPGHGVGRLTRRTPSTGWAGTPRRAAATRPPVASTSPADGATGVATTANITVNFSEAVNVSGAWYTIACPTSGGHTAAVSGGPTSFTLDPASDFTTAKPAPSPSMRPRWPTRTARPAERMAADRTFSFGVGRRSRALLHHPADPGDGNASACQGHRRTSRAASPASRPPASTSRICWRWQHRHLGRHLRLLLLDLDNPG